MEQSMNGLALRLIGIKRAKGIIGLINFTYNLFRYEQVEDMLYAEMMAEKGVNLVRTPSLNDRPLFINALSNLVEQGLKEAGWLE